MPRRVLSILLGLVSSVAITACKQQPAPAPAAVAAAPSTPPSGIRSVGKGAQEAGLEVHVPLVFVDGQPVGVLAYNELPSTLKFDAQHRAKLCDYLKILGAECRDIQRIDFHVAGDTKFVAGADFKKQRNVTFHFADGLGGRARLDGGLVPGDLGDVVVWVKSQPGVLRDDGRRGVRVNVDGRLVAKIKRNLLEGNVEPVTEPRPGQVPRYRLRDFLASRAVTIDHIAGIDLVTRGEEVVRLSTEDLAAGVEFIAPDKGHGEMTFLVGARAIPALAVDVWAETAPPTRPMRHAGELHAALATHP